MSDVDPKRAAWLAYDVNKDGTVTNGRVFFDGTRWRKDPFFGPDGFKVDRQGNIFGARPGGLSVIASDGTLLGTIETGNQPPMSHGERMGRLCSLRAVHRSIVFA